MKIRGLLAAALCLVLTTPAWAGRRVAPPQGVVSVEAGTDTLAVWPYTTSDFETGDDPVNLVFLNADPRAIRQQLMKLNGTRPIPFGCRWTDAMGYEQAAWGEPEGWVGGEVQLACLDDFARPLGSPFRVHVRLFRIGAHTLGAAHFEILIDGTAEHEVLGWDFAREFVAVDMARAGAPSQGSKRLFVPEDGAFRAIRQPVYEPLVTAAQHSPDLLYLLTQVLHLPASVPSSDVPIPTSGEAAVFAPAFALEPVKSDVTTTLDVTYGVAAPKPFCGPGFIQIAGGPLHLEMRVQTNRSGQYLRTYRVHGTLSVTPLAPSGATVQAVISEAHRGLLTDQYGQIAQGTAQVLLGDPVQYRTTRFGAGQADRFSAIERCGP
jgi:hypothetical protein